MGSPVGGGRGGVLGEEGWSGVCGPSSGERSVWAFSWQSAPQCPGRLLGPGPLTPPSPPPGRCWLDALELALRCSSLLRLSACKQGSDREPGSSPDASPSSLCGLPPSATIHDQDLFL